MRFEVLSIPPFDKQLKRLAKKYPSLKNEFGLLLDDLEINPTQGISIGNNCFKITISIKSKGKVNSGGARVITNVLVTEAKVFLLSIYDKSDKENLTDGELIALLKLL